MGPGLGADGGEEEEQTELAQHLVGGAGEAPDDRAGLADAAENEGRGEHPAGEAEIEIHAAGQGDVHAAEEYTADDAKGNGEKIGLRKALVVVAEQLDHLGHVLAVAGHQQLVAEAENAGAPGGDVDIGAADAGDIGVIVGVHVQRGQGLADHRLVGHQHPLHVIALAEGDLPAGLGADEQAALLEGVLGAHGLDQIAEVEQGSGRRGDRGLAVHHARDRRPGHGADVQLADGLAVQIGVFDDEIAVEDLRKSDKGLGGVIMRRLFQVRAQEAGHQAHKEDHPDHPEGIGDAVADRGQWRVGRLDGRRQAGGAGQRSGEEPACHAEIDVKGPGEGDRDRGPGDDDDQGGEDELKAAALEGGEKARPGGDADGEDEEQQPDVLKVGRDAIAVMAENQGDENDRRNIQGDAAHLDMADDDADGDDEKKDEITGVQQGVHDFPLSKRLKCSHFQADFKIILPYM
ncbi:MAG: hypothetical protein BWY77_01093 [bacterium ADurb.Bin431]|nr:MAG: hypothetical protein BWY77_01093 [bacterium ADurb.Bin431]